MSREIKFRVWNGSSMDYSVIAGGIGCFYVNPNNDGLDEADSACISPFNTKYPDEAPIMQYSGLDDLGCNDIYEGDIVEFSSSWDKHVATVAFYGGAFRFGKQLKGSLGVNDDSDLFSFMTGSGCNGYVVIGNIHQNPELLNKLG